MDNLASALCILMILCAVAVALFPVFAAYLWVYTNAAIIRRAVKRYAAAVRELVIEFMEHEFEF